MKKTTETQYFYSDYDDKLNRCVVTETVNSASCDGCDMGEVLANEVEFSDDGTALAAAALALAAVSLCLTAMVSIFRRR